MHTHIHMLTHAQKTAKLLRDELFDAVFSNEYTAVGHGQLQRVPFFDLVKVAQRRQQEDQANLARQLSEVHCREQGLVDALETERAATAAAHANAQELERQAALLQHQIASLTSDLNGARIHAARVSNDAAAEAARLATAADQTRAQLATATAAAHDLRPFKNEYTAAQSSFDVLGACVSVGLRRERACVWSVG